MSSKIRNLILNADDFGACEYIDRGIHKAINEGVITCITAFVNFRERKSNEIGGKYMGSIKALKTLRKKHPHFPIGLHFTINSGPPVSKENRVPNLIRSGVNGKRKFRTIN